MKYEKRLEERKKEIIANSSGCAKCGKTNNLTIDHIIPVSFLVQLALTKEQLYDEDNFEVLCNVCNTFKAWRLDFRNPKTKPLLIHYINLVD